jgi:TolB-like protein/tetratricopeptide (TPR) repeat protein
MKEMNPKAFLSELKRRNVYKVAVAYAVVGWLVMQIAATVVPALHLPDIITSAVVVLTLLGFPIALVIAWAFEMTPEGMKRTENVSPNEVIPQWSRRKFAAFIAGVALLAAVLLVFQFTRPKGTESNVASAKSIAVLPFANLSHDPDNAYFAAGIQDEIVTRLARIGELKAISCTSTQRFKSAPDDLPAIANQLKVANILEGSVQKSGDAVRVNVQLINAENEARLWGDTFDRKLTDVFSIESEIARTIAEKLQAKLTGPEESAVSVKPTGNPEAHQLYLKGRYFWNRRTGENLKKALGYFQQAAEKDPGYALAYTGIADSCALIPVYGAGPPQDYYPRAKAAAEKAVALDDMLGEAHVSVANVLFRYLKLDESAKEFERGIELNPSYATAHQWYGRLTLLATGQFDHAIAEMNRAIELDPISPIIHADLGSVYIGARRYDEAIKEFRTALELDPQFYWAHRNLAAAFELSGAPENAIVEYHKALELSDDPRVLAFLGHAEASLGRQNEARAILKQLSEIAKTRYVSGYGFVVIDLALGEREQALEWLEKDARERSGFEINFIRVDPFLDPLRSDPRFEALVSKVMSGRIEQPPDPARHR